jgi:hypothetical protein
VGPPPSSGAEAGEEAAQAPPEREAAEVLLAAVEVFPAGEAGVAVPRAAEAVRRPAVEAFPAVEAEVAPRVAEESRAWKAEVVQPAAAARRLAAQQGLEAAVRRGPARRLALAEARIVRGASARRPASPGSPEALRAECRRSLPPIARASSGSERRRRARPHGARSRLRQRAGVPMAGGAAAAARGRGRRASWRSRCLRVRRGRDRRAWRSRSQRIWRGWGRRNNTARTRHDRDPRDSVGREFVHYRHDVAIGSIAVATQLNHAVGVGQLRLDLVRQLIPRDWISSHR